MEKGTVSLAGEKSILSPRWGGSYETEKIQFVVAARSEFPNVPADANFVNAAVIKTSIPQDSPSVIKIEDIEQTVVQDNPDEEPEPVVPPKPEPEPELEPIVTTDDSVGKKFRYTMRTNSKNYLMEFLDGGAISADVISETQPNGVITHTKTSEKDMIDWTTDVDEENPDWMQKWGGAKLYSDQETLA